MPRTLTKPLLVDKFGRPMALSTGWTEFYEGANRYRNGDQTFLDNLDAARDTDSLLTQQNWRDLMTAGRFLFTNVPIVRGVLMEQASYSFPLEPHYTGQDDEWGLVAKEWLYHWKKSSDLRGFDCHTAARMRLFGRRTDGGMFRAFVIDESGMPKLQFIRAHRVGTRKADKDGRLEKGPWRGYRIDNGIVSDDYGRCVAILIIGKKEEDDQFLPESPAQLRAMGGVVPFHHSCNPDWPDVCRPPSELAVSITKLNEFKRWMDAEMRAQEAQARETLIEYNDLGEGDADPGSDGTPLTTVGGTPYNTTVNGQTRYYRSNSGGKLELVRPDRPGPGTLEFRDRMISEALYGIEWDPNFALLIKQPTGANIRVIVRKVNAAIRNIQRIEAAAQLWEDTQALARAVTLKLIPKPKNGDILSWDYFGPPQLTADTGNDESAKRERYKIGALTMRQWAAEDGCWWEETRRQKEVELRDLLKRATAVQKDFPELTLRECADMLEQRTPNGAQMAAQQQEKEEET